jgi:hypothetical protein
MTAIPTAALAPQTSVIVAVLPHSSNAQDKGDNALCNWQNYPAVLDHDTPPRLTPTPLLMLPIYCDLQFPAWAR